MPSRFEGQCLYASAEHRESSKRSDSAIAQSPESPFSRISHISRLKIPFPHPWSSVVIRGQDSFLCALRSLRLSQLLIHAYPLAPRAPGLLRPLSPAPARKSPLSKTPSSAWISSMVAGNPKTPAGPELTRLSPQYQTKVPSQPPMEKRVTKILHHRVTPIT